LPFLKGRQAEGGPDP